MSVKSKLKGVTDAIAGFVPDADDETATALADLRSTERIVADLDTKMSKAAGDLATLEQREGEEALAAEIGDASQYNKFKDEIATARERLARLEAAQRAAVAKVAAAQSNLYRLGKRSLVKTFLRLTKMRAQAATELSAAIDNYAKTFEKILDLNSKIAFTFPGGIAPAGVMLGNSDFLEQLSVELHRVLPRSQIGIAYHPALPGAHNGMLLGNPEKLPTLVAKIEQANSYIMRKVEEGPARIEAVKSAPAPQPQPATPELSAGQTVSAAEIMATAKPVVLKI